MMNNIVSGEKIQQLCDIYLGTDHDFNYNPLISIQKNKQKNIFEINSEYDNPKIIFCYSHYINLFSNIIHYFKNNFILVTHNSDTNIINNENIKNILDYPKLLKWFAQNACIEHEKLYFLPIGIANSQWEHGKIIELLENIILKNIIKTNNIYFYFNIETNYHLRNYCYDLLKDNLEWLPFENAENNIKRLSTYKFCICPEGNGYDTHRLWECLYLKVVPIVIDTPFTKKLLYNNIPLVVLNNWSDLNIINLDYNDYILQFERLELTNLLDINKINELCNA